MEKNLTAKESMVYFAKISRRSRIIRYILTLAFLATGAAAFYYFDGLQYMWMALLAIGFMMLIITEISLYSHRLYITNIAITERIGIVSRRIKTVEMEDVIDIVITQSAWQRMIGYGELHVNTAEDKKHDEIVVPCISRPMKVKKIIEETIRKRPYYPNDKTPHTTQTQETHLNTPSKNKSAGDLQPRS